MTPEHFNELDEMGRKFADDVFEHGGSDGVDKLVKNIEGLDIASPLERFLFEWAAGRRFGYRSAELFERKMDAEGTLFSIENPETLNGIFDGFEAFGKTKGFWPDSMGQFAFSLSKYIDSVDMSAPGSTASAQSIFGNEESLMREIRTKNGLNAVGISETEKPDFTGYPSVHIKSTFQSTALDRRTIHDSGGFAAILCCGMAESVLPVGKTGSFGSCHAEAIGTFLDTMDNDDVRKIKDAILSPSNTSSFKERLWDTPTYAIANAFLTAIDPDDERPEAAWLFTKLPNFDKNHTLTELAKKEPANPARRNRWLSLGSSIILDGLEYGEKARDLAMVENRLLESGMTMEDQAAFWMLRAEIEKVELNIKGEEKGFRTAKQTTI